MLRGGVELLPDGFDLSLLRGLNGLTRGGVAAGGVAACVTAGVFVCPAVSVERTNSASSPPAAASNCSTFE